MARENKTEPDVFGGAQPPEQTVTLSLSDLNALIAQQVAAAVVVSSPNAQSNGIKDVLDQMAMSIAEMTHQSNRTHKPVDPRVLAARRAGQDRLETLLAKVQQARKEAFEAVYETESQRQAAVLAASPRYRVISLQALDEDLIAPVVQNPATKKAEPVEIYWSREPNDGMVPLNDIAKQVHAAFRESRGARTEFEKRAMPMWMTENGLVVEGRAPRRREVALPSVIRDTAIETPVARDADSSFVNVLGTTHAPFQRNWQGKTP